MTREIQNSPNLLIIGPPKSGTTFLFQILRMHPDICASIIKETRYFSPILRNETIRSFDNYLKYFKHYNNERVIMEATPGYFYGGENMATKIKEILEVGFNIGYSSSMWLEFDPDKKSCITSIDIGIHKDTLPASKAVKDLHGERFSFILCDSKKVLKQLNISSHQNGNKTC